MHGGVGRHATKADMYFLATILFSDDGSLKGKNNSECKEIINWRQY